jgi:hypothetical protein
MEILVYLKDLRDALVCTGRRLFRARERKDEIVGTIAELRKGAVLAGRCAEHGMSHRIV